jgi:hypothetical protein
VLKKGVHHCLYTSFINYHPKVLNFFFYSTLKKKTHMILTHKSIFENFFCLVRKKII